VFDQGSDMHTLTSELAGITRKNAKILNFAYVYGATEHRLTSELVKAGLSSNKARTTTRTYLDVMSKIGIADYQKKLLTSAKKIGYTSSVYGRIGDRMNPTQVVNFPIQSFSADLNKIRILEMHNLLRQHKCISRLWLEFHDAMELDVYKPELELVYNLIEQVDTRIPDINNSGIVLDLPLDIKEHGPNWN
jgi:DNA polymerase I-like protein with 3'-5' exonuclease and polymerase domains